MAKHKDRIDVLKFIDGHPEGINTAAIAAHFGQSYFHMREVCGNFRKDGRLVLIGKAPLCRWTTPRNVEATQAWRDAHRAANLEKQRVRSNRKRQIYKPRPKSETITDDVWLPRQVIVPASQCKPPAIGVRSVFELGAA
jgi:hypothetical protein